MIDDSVSITAESSRAWLRRRPLKVERYLRHYHNREDIDNVSQIIYGSCPDEGRKLVEYFNLQQQLKKDIFCSWLVLQPQITCGIFADQRYGKDATVCKIIDDCLDFCKLNNLRFPRIITLGNIRCPPFVFNGWDTDFVYMLKKGLLTDEEVLHFFLDGVEPSRDMYFSFKNIPVGSKFREVWIYSSEIETILPARETQTSPENKLFSYLEGTMAQNHQKLFGCCKLASKVDLNFLRGMNTKIFKFISPDKLNIQGVERANLLSDLARWHLPRDSSDKRQTLLSFNDYLFDVEYDLPYWWTETYSEQFRNIPLDKVYEFIECSFSNGLTPSSIQIAVCQKFRFNLSFREIKDYLSDKSL